MVGEDLAVKVTFEQRREGRKGVNRADVLGERMLGTEGSKLLGASGRERHRAPQEGLWAVRQGAGPASLHLPLGLVAETGGVSGPGGAPGPPARAQERG